MPSNSRQDILKSIAAAEKGRLTFDMTSTLDTDAIYKPILPDILTCFKNELETISGQCVLCDNKTDLYAKLKKFVLQQNFPYVFCRDNYIIKQLEIHNISCSNTEFNFEEMQVGITGCELLVARTGSVLVSSASTSGRQMIVFPPIHIVIAHVSQLVEYLEDAYLAIQKKYGDDLPSTISTITGPSRTADIEKTLVLGAHGPKEFIVFLSKI